MGGKVKNKKGVRNSYKKMKKSVGDKNQDISGLKRWMGTSNFFHRMAYSKRSKSQITKILVDGSIEDHEEFEQSFQYYRSLNASSLNPCRYVEGLEWGCLPHGKAEYLERRFEEEIHSAVLDMDGE